MPPPRSITLLSPDELRIELVALLSDALLHYATRGRLARERSSQEKSIESETASLELGWEETRSALCRLQLGQARARLLESLVPPFTRGTTCSM
jgi:hypothetical protein